MAKNDAWLASGAEDALEPEMDICDPHHHLWLNQPHRISPRYGFEEIHRDVSAGHKITSTVFIEAATMYRADGPAVMRPVGETEFVNGIAAMAASGEYGPCRIAAGIVGAVNLTLGAAVAPALDAHIAAAGGRFKGIRHGVAWDADPALPDVRTKPGPELLMDARYRAGVAEVASRGLSLDIWCFHPQIREVTDMARQFPDLTIILDHFGVPLGVGAYAGCGDQVFTQWKADITELASCPNVMVKLGGIAMPENGFDWHKQPRPPTSLTLMQATRRYYETTIELFGVDRCMFESNFPVDSISCGYNTVWNSFKLLTQDWSKAERSALFHDTAVRVYRL
jgi:L-fuconolactonase